MSKSKKSGGGFLKFVILPVMILALGSIGYYFYYQVAHGATNENMKVIKDHLNNAGVLVDNRNEIGVKSVDDIKLFVTEKEVRIEFGYLILTWTPRQFAEKETQDALKMLGFEVKFEGDPVKMNVYWQGEKIERWVK